MLLRRLALVVCLTFFGSLGCLAQLPLELGTKPVPNPLSDTTLSPGTAFLYQLEQKFAADTAKGGGKAFASYFASDAVTLSNGRAPVHGLDAIAKGATWLASEYQLTWTPQGGQMSPSGDMGFTWGSYEGLSKDKQGNPVVEKGRYMTIWKKQPDGSWKVVLDSSNDAPPESGDCCRVQ